MNENDGLILHTQTSLNSSVTISLPDCSCTNKITEQSTSLTMGWDDPEAKRSLGDFFVLFNCCKQGLGLLGR